MSDLQRDMHLVDLAFGIAFDDNDPSAEAWQRIKARLTPDREVLILAVEKALEPYIQAEHLPLIAAKASLSAMFAAAQAPPATLADASSAWAEGYRAGVLDERTSEANIGIAGFGAKIEPARENPYAKAQKPAAAVPAGYVLVPVEPTTAMKCRAVEAWEGPAAYKSIFARGLADLEDKAAECWDAMLAAARKGE